MIKRLSTKLLAMLVVAMMVVSAFAQTVLAADNGSIKITNATAGKVYDVYRIFDLEYTDEDGTKLYSYTMNSEFKEFFKTHSGNAQITDAEAVAIVSALEDNSDALNAFAAAVKKYALETPVAPVESKTAAAAELIIDNLPLGYYLVYPEGGLSAACSLTTTDPNGEVVVKTEYPTIEKSIVEDGKEMGSTSAAVGDVIQFKLESTIPDMTGYDSYKYVITDTMSKGLTFIPGAADDDDDTGVDMTVNGVSLNPSWYTVSTEEAGEGTKLTITFVDFYNHFKLYSGQTLAITYSAAINENAVVGSEGNSNNVELEYSNNPEEEGSFEKTPPDEVTVYTFRLDAVKVDAANHQNKLKDAVFSLWTTTEVDKAVTKEYTAADNSTVTLYQLKADLTTDENGKFSHKVKEGTYYLFEETAPAGYNKMTDPIIFTVTPVYVNNVLTGLTIDNEALTSTAASGVIETTIENRSGLLLPSTGGIGTVIFTVSGILLMGLALVLYLVYRRRTKAAQQ